MKSDISNSVNISTSKQKKTSINLQNEVENKYEEKRVEDNLDFFSNIEQTNKHKTSQAPENLPTQDKKNFTDNVNINKDKIAQLQINSVINSKVSLENIQSKDIKIPVKKTIPKDPLFAARILEQQKPQNDKKNDDSFVSVKETKPKKAPIIRTYKSDVAKALKKEKTSMVQMVLAEHKKKEDVKKKKLSLSKKNTRLIVVSVILFVVTFAILSIVTIYLFDKKITENHNKKTIASSLIFTEEQKEINLTNLSQEKIIKLIQDEIMMTDIRLDFIKYLYFVENGTVQTEDGTEIIPRELSLQKMFNILNMRMPDRLIRSLDSNFMFGIHAFNGNQPFIILKTSYFENVFAGMLEWEPFLAQDIFPLFAYNETNAVYAEKFEDVIIKNRDMRVLKNEKGEIILLYTFIDKNTAIITTNTDTLNEIILRLNRKK